MPNDVLIASWKMLLVRGAVAVVFGIVAVAWPDTTIIVLVVLWGIWALVDGIGLAAQRYEQLIRKCAGVRGVVHRFHGRPVTFDTGSRTGIVRLWSRNDEERRA